MLQNLQEIHSIVNKFDPKGIDCSGDPVMSGEYYAECHSVLISVDKKITVKKFMTLLKRELRKNFCHSFRTKYNREALNNIQEALISAKLVGTFK